MPTSPTFSIVTPVYNRPVQIWKPFYSVLHQHYPKELYEYVIVDDGSDAEMAASLRAINEYGQKSGMYGQIIDIDHRGRAAARNEGMKAARNEWICWLDSDDEYVSDYLKMAALAIANHPAYDIFNWGDVLYDLAVPESRIRQPFQVPIGPDGKHAAFRSGQIGTGMFIFKKELLKEVGYLPEALNPYGHPDSFAALAQKQFPELQKMYGQNENGEWKPFGNPWGDDYLMFYMLTRNHLCKTIPIHPYLYHIRH